MEPLDELEERFYKAAQHQKVNIPFPKTGSRIFCPGGFFLRAFYEDGNHSAERISRIEEVEIIRWLTQNYDTIIKQLRNAGNEKVKEKLERQKMREEINKERSEAMKELKKVLEEKE